MRNYGRKTDEKKGERVRGSTFKYTANESVEPVLSEDKGDGVRIAIFT